MAHLPFNQAWRTFLSIKHGAPSFQSSMAHLPFNQAWRTFLSF